jgi:hypothetical protein
MVDSGSNILRKVFPLLCLHASYLLGQAQRPEPSLIERYSQEGARALAEQRYPEAERAYERLRELTPDTPELHANLGLIYFGEEISPSCRILAPGSEA